MQTISLNNDFLLSENSLFSLKTWMNVYKITQAIGLYL